MTTTTPFLSAPQDVLTSLQDLEIKSFVPGRLRLRSPLLSALPPAAHLNTFTSDLVNAIKISALTHSLVLYYDTTKYSRHSFMQELQVLLGLGAAATSAINENFLS
jgi:hypothetical protein